MPLKAVRERLMEADIVIPTLNAVSTDIFNEIMRPSFNIEPQQIIEGLIEFRKEYKGLIYLEVFIVPGLNDMESELVKIRDAAMLIKPDQVHINHLDRPGSEEWVRSAELDQLKAAGKLFYPFHVKILTRPVITLEPSEEM
jgi:wyosine [tRNA(Phe)-imidazoG37] synthetase (radical SAM superfamily)